jgi:hypothetical protein
MKWTSSTEKNKRVCKRIHKKEFSKREYIKIQGGEERISRQKIKIPLVKEHHQVRVDELLNYHR